MGLGVVHGKSLKYQFQTWDKESIYGSLLNQWSFYQPIIVYKFLNFHFSSKKELKSIGSWNFELMQMVWLSIQW